MKRVALFLFALTILALCVGRASAHGPRGAFSVRDGFGQPVIVQNGIGFSAGFSTGFAGQAVITNQFLVPNVVASPFVGATVVTPGSRFFVGRPFFGRRFSRRGVVFLP